MSYRFPPIDTLDPRPEGCLTSSILPSPQAPTSFPAGVLQAVEVALSSQDLLEGPQLLPSPRPGFQR